MRRCNFRHTIRGNEFDYIKNGGRALHAPTNGGKMKKFLTILIILIVFILIYLLQTNFFNWFTIAGIKPNLFIIFALFLGLFMGEIYGGIIGAILGVLLDLFIGNAIRNKWNCANNSRFSRRKA